MTGGGAQLEDGFVRIANELYDAILRAPFSKRELLIVLAVIRKTYGFGKKEDDVTMTQLAEITGLARSHVSETVHALAAKNVFLIRDGEHGKIISIHKRHSLWKLVPESGQIPKTGRVPKREHDRPESGTVASQNGNNSVPNREITRPESGHTIDNPKRQLQKTTPIGSDPIGTVVPLESVAGPSAAAQTWAAYRDAYADRYGVEPVRNAKVNGQLAGLVKRIGADEAPDVAAFYVRHNGGFYVRTGHSVDALLKDAEKLRTEWATNTRITETRARQSDRTEANGQVWARLLAKAEANESNT